MKLIFTWGFSPDDRDSLITVSLRADGNETEVILTHEGEADAATRKQREQRWSSPAPAIVLCGMKAVFLWVNFLSVTVHDQLRLFPRAEVVNNLNKSSISISGSAAPFPVADKWPAREPDRRLHEQEPASGRRCARDSLAVVPPIVVPFWRLRSDARANQPRLGRARPSRESTRRR